MQKCKCNLLHEKIILIAYFCRVLPIIVNGRWNALFIETVNKLMQRFVSKCYVADSNDIPELLMIGSFLAYIWPFSLTKPSSLQISLIKASQHKLMNDFTVVVTKCKSSDCGITQSNTWTSAKWKALVHKCFWTFSRPYIFSLQCELR